MSGIFDRIASDVEDRVPVHLLTAAIFLAGEGTFTNAQVLAGLNSVVTTPLDTDAESDLLAIKTNATAGNISARASYAHRLESICIAVECGVYTNEAGFRTILGL